MYFADQAPERIKSIKLRREHLGNYWLRIIVNSQIDDSSELAELIKISRSLIKILSSITKTTRDNLNDN